MSLSKDTYIFSRVIAGIVSAAGALAIVVSVGYFVLVKVFGSPIQVAMFQASAGRLIVIACVGLFLLAFGLLCRAVFHIAQSSKTTSSG